MTASNMIDVANVIAELRSVFQQHGVRDDELDVSPSDKHAGATFVELTPRSTEHARITIIVEPEQIYVEVGQQTPFEIISPRSFADAKEECLDIVRAVLDGYFTESIWIDRRGRILRSRGTAVVRGKPTTVGRTTIWGWFARGIRKVDIAYRRYDSFDVA